MEGWIKLHRQLLEWEWYDEPNTFRLFMHCLLKANHKDKMYRGQLVKSGSFLTSRDLLASETGLTTQQVRTSLKRLESTNEITTKKSKKGTVLQIVKYVTYQHDNQQNNQRFNQQLTNNQPTANQQLTTNKNDNNDNNEKNIYKIEDKAKKIIERFDETSFTRTEETLKTNKEEIKKRLIEFLEVESLTPTFENKQLGEILKHFRNWLNYNKPKEVVKKDNSLPTWVQYAKDHE